jgi:hypothetical protein
MYYEGSTVVLYWMKLSRIVVWVLWKIYRCIILNVNYHEWLYEYYKGSTVVFLLNVIVTNCCMSITKDLPFYYIECNCDECITNDLPFYYIECNCDECITQDLSLYYIEWNCHEWLYKYYKRSTVVLYWMLIITNGCMSITRDLLLYCIEH